MLQKLKDIASGRVPFGKAWAQTLWQAMAKTGKGFRQHSLRHTGRYGFDKDAGKVTCDARADKVQEIAGGGVRRLSKLERRAKARTLTKVHP